MQPASHAHEERATYIREARETSFLSAVFLMTHYNSTVRLRQPAPAPASIEPRELFESFDPEALAQAAARSTLLLRTTGYVGAAYFSYAGAMAYDEALQKMLHEHPGFTERCYDIAAWQNIQAMR
jgi:hypothetical protein